MGGLTDKKVQYFVKLKELLQEYNSIFVVGIDNVSSQQMHQIRKSLRNKAVILMGKNTMVRRAIRGFLSDFPEYEKLLPFIKGNIGLVFTNDDLKELKEIILSNVVSAPAKIGAVAPSDIWVPAGNTGMDPAKTSFFQALGVPTKIARGMIEISSDIKVVEQNKKVGQSEATLLNLLNISPFTYGMTIEQIYDNGQTFPVTILNVTEEELLKHFTESITKIASISLAINYPTLPSIPHTLVNNFKNILALSVASDYTFEGSEAIKDRLENPDAYASETVVEKVVEKTEEVVEAEKEESDDDMGFGLFD